MARRGSRAESRRAPRNPGSSADVSPWDDASCRVSRTPRVGSSLLVRARVRMRRFSLDQQLARGADPRLDAELARRAKELCQPKLRRRLSEDIERAVEEASVPARLLTAAIPLNRRSVESCRPSLLALAHDLRSPGPVYARGVAQVRRLLIDGASPLYVSSDPYDLEEEVRRAKSALWLG